jgi:hypothetical protein
MKAKYFTILFLTLAFANCRKDNDKKKQININIPVGTIVADIDGIKTTFNIEAIADTVTEQFDFYSKIFRMEISGKNNTLSNSQKINVKFWAKPVRVIDNGTYPDLDKQIYNYIDYIDKWTYSINGYEPYLSKGTIVRNDSIVQGTFSGKLIIGIGPGADQPQPPLSHNIENGMFNVRIKQ